MIAGGRFLIYINVWTLLKRLHMYCFNVPQLTRRGQVSTSRVNANHLTFLSSINPDLLLAPTIAVAVAVRGMALSARVTEALLQNSLVKELHEEHGGPPAMAMEKTHRSEALVVTRGKRIHSLGNAAVVLRSLVSHFEIIPWEIPASMDSENGDIRKTHEVIEGVRLVTVCNQLTSREAGQGGEDDGGGDELHGDGLKGCSNYIRGKT